MKLTATQLREIVEEEIEKVGRSQSQKAAESEPRGVRSEDLLRAAIREAVLAEITVGDVRKAIETAAKEKNVKKAKEAAKAAGNAAVGLALDAMTFGGASLVKNLVTAGMTLKDIYSGVKSVDAKAKEQNPILDTMSIDPSTSAIVDDEVEDRFVADLAAAVERLPDTTDLPDADKALSNWLKGKFQGAHVTK